VDAPLLNNGTPGPLELILRLDLVTTDGSPRAIHWEDAPAHAAYPEEAFDELARWAPGSRHSIYQLRGDARAIRLPGAYDYPERSSALSYFFFAAFASVFLLVPLSMLAQIDPLLEHIPLVRHVGVWTVFAFTGIACLSGAALFAWYEVPKRISWTPVAATVAEVDPQYPSASLPPNAVVTPGARAKLASLPAHRVVTFSWNGATLHGGIGHLDGPFDEINSACLPLSRSCEFVISPTNRWDVAPSNRWDATFFAPFILLSLLGLGMGYSGILMRRQTQRF
jgi:hypothetical protein